MNGERGSMTVWAAAVVALIVLGMGVVLTYGSAVVGRHRAETAADLAALAAAVHVPYGATTACRVAVAIAGRNGGAVRSCRVAGQDVEIEVSRTVQLAGLGRWTVAVRARAGPIAPS